MIRNLLFSASVFALGVTGALPVGAQSVSGAYLAGRHAAVRSDFSEAADYYGRALARDSMNVELLESAILANLSLGDVDRAIPLAKVLAAKHQESQVAHLVTTADNAQRGDYDGLLAQEGDGAGIGPWVDGLVKAWAYVGKGDMTQAVAEFDTLSREPGMQGFVMYHKALALASVGDFEGAERIFAANEAGAAGHTRRGVIARAEILGQLDRNAEALALLNSSFGGSTDPELEALTLALEGGEPVKFAQAPDAKAGIAEVFFTFAAVLRSESAGEHYVLLYARIARYLNPRHIDALLLTADLLESLEQYDLAIAELANVPASDPAYHAAELGRAAALRRSGQPGRAIEVLQQLTRSHGDLPSVHSALGDALRAEDKFDDAIAAYDMAINKTPDTNPQRWVLFYARGISQERSGDLDKAEADFRAALAINPDQPQVLNYLGYSLVEQGRNLDEALNMIERAVAASPGSGYIVDSLGWVLYRLGRYEEAVSQMERAVELVAVDPVVNDHLGDVYWAVGREREAEFQWRRALSFVDPEDTDSEADPGRMRRKLEIGLDAVLSEEGADPLSKVSTD
ncbi:Flp pilus assembly protein TadD, contains TPR repeats [Sulfitobacter marinus]|uniref:Flp pilus assembly protein TadD, contains TPR repeats n=1 Tax=Sulfitobacter marinus TaxID=394264 RepID=A0A1I6RI25_9RHOB|nr:tetratricopeptide repeat protein [Sulfitobacter marinus]SFS64315.1 Flp pilus assembly protein TadD, contains TPR repeats [Sulfitobacter marinus]